MQQSVSGFQPPPLSGGTPILAADTVYVDDFNRADGPPGADWLADSTMLIVSNELDNTDTGIDIDDIAVYTAHTNPLGVALKWSATADPNGIDKGGLALRLTGTDTNVNGYYIFRNQSDNKYALWTLENGAITTRVTTQTSTLPYPSGGDDFQIVLRSDGGGHHFDIYYNNQFDVTLTDPFKLQGNSSTLYDGILLGGNVNNNVDEFTFVSYDDDATPPTAISDLAAISAGGTSIKLRWTAPGDDGTSGVAGSYDVRFATFEINESNWASAIKVIGEPVPSAPGSLDSLTITNLLPETTYWFAIKTSDGFPKNNISGLSNVETGQTLDDVPPSQVSDLNVVSVAARTILLSWTAPGDSDTSGTATSYDVRFSETPINQDNFSSARRGTGEPTPDPYGTYQEYTINKLEPNMTYYFAMRTEDEQGNRSLVSNTVTGETIDYPWALDDFERPVLGEEFWTADPELQIVGGELTNVSTEDRWDFSAIFHSITNVKEVDFWWGNVDNSSTGTAGVVLMMDSPDPDANGYLLFRNPNNDKVALWDVSNGVPSYQISGEVDGGYDPVSGDRIRVVVSTDMNGNHFDYWVNGGWIKRVSDPDKLHSFSGTKYSGVMMRGTYQNNIAQFSLSSPVSTLPPSDFNLFLPFDGDTIDVGDPLLDWTDSYDLNIDDSVHYSLWYGTDPLFYDNTTFVDSIWVSEYQIPGSQLGRILRNYLADRKNQNEVTILPDNAQIFWRVRAKDTTGLETMSAQLDWSFYVSIPDAPMPFDLLSPVDGSTVGTLFPTVVWHQAVDPDPDAQEITYELWYDRSEEFDSPTIIGGLSDTTFTLPGLLNLSWYYWKVFAEDEDGLRGESSSYYSFWTDSSYTGVEEGEPTSPVLPKMFTLGQNYPNPFNPLTSITYDVPESADGQVHVQMDVFNIRGVKVTTLVNEVKESGQYVITWDGRDDNNRKVSSGIYFYRMKAGNFVSTKKMVILK